MGIKSGISPCGNNIYEALMEKNFKIFGPKESNRKLEITAPWVFDVLTTHLKLLTCADQRE